MKQCPLKAAAKAAGEARYTSSRACSKGHGFERLTRNGTCVECAKITRRESYARIPGQKEQAAKYARDRRAADPLTARRKQSASRLFKTYGITETQHTAMFLAQGRCCAICGDRIISRFEDERVWSGNGAPPNDSDRVDHCHLTGAVRGLLCSNCNQALGKFQDSQKVLLNAVRYLDENRTAQAQPSESRYRFEAKAGRETGTPNELCGRESRRDELSPFQLT